jgi:hypothetical protein
MSRGHGAIQRAVVEFLAAAPRAHAHAFRRDRDCPGHDSTSAAARAADARIHGWPQWHTIVSIAGWLAEGEPSRALIESVRRAAKRLAAEGAAEVGYTTGETFRGVWVVHMQMLAVRPVLADAERAAEAAMRDTAQRRAREAIAAARARS